MATKEEATTAEGMEWDSEPRTETAGGTPESSADRRLGDAMAGGVNTRKASSAATGKVGAGGRHAARPEQRGRLAGRQENPASESSEVRGDDSGREAFVVAHKSPGVGEEEGGSKASRVVENPRGYRQGVGGGVESPQGTDTPGVADFPRGDETPGVTTAGEGVPGEDGRGQGGAKNPSTT